MNYEAALREAYEKERVLDGTHRPLTDISQYSKNDIACILAGLDGDAIVLPPSSISWLINQPDSAISTDESTKHVLQTRYSFTVPEIMDRTIHFGK